MTRPDLLVVMSLLAFGCECGERPPPRVETPSEPASTPALPIEPLALASRDDLPRAVPAITITLAEDRFVVSNASLVESWPRGERERLAAAPPPGAPTGYPILRVEGAFTTEGFREATLGAALTSMREVERARSGAGGPSFVAFRVSPDVASQRVMRAVISAAFAGFVEPRFVLRRGEDEVELRIPLPEAPPAASEAAPQPGRVDPNAGALLRERLSTIAASPLPAAHEPSITLGLDEAGLVATVEHVRRGPGCARPAIGREPSLQRSQLDRASIEACFRGLGPSPGGSIVSVGDGVPFRSLALVLEQAPRPVSLATTFQ